MIYKKQLFCHIKIDHVKNERGKYTNCLYGWTCFLLVGVQHTYGLNTA